MSGGHGLKVSWHAQMNLRTIMPSVENEKRSLTVLTIRKQGLEGLGFKAGMRVNNPLPFGGEKVYIPQYIKPFLPRI